MAELGWKEAIVKVLEKSAQPMHYTDITQAIATDGLKTKVGATPASSVYTAIFLSLKNEGEHSPFLKVSRGVYTLNSAKGTRHSKIQLKLEEKEEADETGFINAFGMYWQRDKVLWKTTPKILGQQQSGSQPVDFCQQKGVYLLLDGSKVVYVGRTTDQALGLRLKQHTTDRLNGRWNRFSWFGVFAVSDNGSLSASPPETFNIDNLIVTMEAILIEGLEPPQNRKRGDDFSAVEFTQVEDPEIQKNRAYELIERLKKNV
jgi:hypothetical protein